MSTKIHDASPLGEQILAVDTWSSHKGSPSIDEFEYIDIASVDREKKTIVGTTLTYTANAPSRARQIVRRNDVLVSTVRPNLNAVAVVPEALCGAVASTGFCVLRSDPERLCHRYLYHWVRTPFFVADMVRKATGASYPAVSDAVIKDSSIPLPPLPEQKRIADILDKADAIRRKRQEAIDQAEHILRSSYVELFGDPVANPNNWPMEDLGSVADMVSGFAFKSVEYTSEGVRLCRGANVLPDIIEWSDVRYWRLDDITIDPRMQLLSGDVVLAMDRP